MATNYEKYLQAIEEERNRQAPVYQSTRQAEIDALVKDIQNSRYNYDQSNDPKAANASRAYGASAQRAMRDTLGTASAMTGGRSNSYAQTAAQQAYSRQMEGLNTYLDQLEEANFARYQSDLAKKQSDLAMLQNLENADYAKWQNEQNAIDAKRKQDINYLYNLAQVDAANAQAAATAQANLYKQQQDSIAATQKQLQNAFTTYKQDYAKATTDADKMNVFSDIWRWANVNSVDQDLLNTLLDSAGIDLATFIAAVESGFAVPNNSASTNKTRSAVLGIGPRTKMIYG